MQPQTPARALLHLIAVALVAAALALPAAADEPPGEFEHRICEDAPGGHSFNRLDTLLAQESRREIYAFLGRYLKP